MCTDRFDAAISQLKWSWYQNPRPLNDFTTFDLASRGIWGSLQLLQRTHGLHLTSLGAVITILAAASDPFVQQTIKYRPISQAANGSLALMPRSTYYSSSGAHEGAGFNAVDDLTQTAIYRGVYNSSSAITPTCSTGNCTFPEYRTLGICSRCSDISATIQRSYWKSPYETTCNLTLPSGLEVPAFSPLIMNLRTVVNSGYTDFVQNISEMTQTELLSYGNDMRTNASNFFAADCKLYPCVQTYKTGITVGDMSEKLLDTSQMFKPSTSPFDIFTSTPMPCLINGTYHDASAFTERNDTKQVAITGLLENNQTAFLPPDCVFEYDPLGVSEYLAGFLKGNMNIPMAGGGDPDWVAQLFEGDNTSFARVEAIWAALAESLTINIRLNSESNFSSPAVGTAYRTETCIIVQWPWLAYPAALLLLTLVFLAATIVQSRRRTRHQIWKASPLALLLHGVEDDVKGRCRHEIRTSEMEKSVREVNVLVGRGRDSLMLVSA